MPESRTHTNSEPVRQCPYCDWTGKSRGLTFHVLNSSDPEHGDKHDLPPDFDASEAEIVGYEDVEVNMPEHYNTSRRKRFVCDYCGKVCRGEGGLKVHLSHMEGDSVHPAEATDRDPESFPTFLVDEDGKLVSATDDALTIAGTGEGYESMVPMKELLDLREQFKAMADRGESLEAIEAAEMLQDLLDKYTNIEPSA